MRVMLYLFFCDLSDVLLGYSSVQKRIDKLNTEMQKSWWKQLLEADADAAAIQSLQQFIRDTYQIFVVGSCPVLLLLY